MLHSGICQGLVRLRLAEIVGRLWGLGAKVERTGRCRRFANGELAGVDRFNSGDLPCGIRGDRELGRLDTALKITSAGVWLAGAHRPKGSQLMNRFHSCCRLTV